MRNQVWSSRVQIAFGIAACVVLVFVLLCWRWRIWTPAALRSYRTVQQYAIGEDLWFGRIAPGHDAQLMAAKYPPHRVQQIGSFTLYSYYPGGPIPPDGIPFESLGVMAKDGKLVRAGAACCVWSHTFFEMNSEQVDEYEKALEREVSDRERAHEERLAQAAIWAWASPRDTVYHCTLAVAVANGEVTAPPGR